ncbi:MAG: hypothetical protein KK482_24300 [Sinorhizobium meliloti]|nr:hypothetical protein [Sinorhizobium meliloti]
MQSWHAALLSSFHPIAISRMTLGLIGGYRRFSNVWDTQELCHLRRNKNLLYCSIAYMRVQVQAGPNTTVSQIRQIEQSVWLLNVSSTMAGRGCRWQGTTGGSTGEALRKHSSGRQFTNLGSLAGALPVRINISRRGFGRVGLLPLASGTNRRGVNAPASTGEFQ